VAGRARARGPAGAAALLVAAFFALVLVSSCSSSGQGTAAAVPPSVTSPPSGAASGPTAPAASSPPAPSSPSPAPTSGATDPSAAASRTAAPRATPVFVDEPCDPGGGAGPQLAINGLNLYCVSSSGGEPVWSTSPPPSPTPTPTNAGSTCAKAQDGHYARGADGRPLECIHDPDGGYRWTDVS
jgi:hypothetical protein